MIYLDDTHDLPDRDIDSKCSQEASCPKTITKHVACEFSATARAFQVFLSIACLLQFSIFL